MRSAMKFEKYFPPIFLGLVCLSRATVGGAEALDFAQWEAAHAQEANQSDSQDTAFMERISKDDKVTKSFVALKSLLPEQQKDGRSLAIEVMDELSAGDVRGLAMHPLISHMLLSFYNLASPKDPYTKLASDFLHVIGGSSCATKDFVDGQLFTATHDQEAYTLYLRIIADFRSLRARRKSLSLLMSQMPESYQAIFKQDLQLLLLDLPDLAKNAAWLGLGGSTPVPSDAERFADNLKSFLKKGQCQQAALLIDQQLLLQGSTLNEVVDHYEQVSRCLRKGALKERVEFWEARRPQLVKSHGWVADLRVNQKLSHVYWVSNQFEEARTYIGLAIEGARQKSDPLLLSESLYQLALIYENEGNDADAILTLEQLEQVGQAESSLLFDALRVHGLLLMERERWAEGSQIFSELVQAQEKLPASERDVSFHGLALFWRGYADFMRDERTSSQRDWARLADEWSSTYYGAAGDFLLERTGGREPMAEPELSRASFSQSWMYEGFSQSQAMVLQRVESLLRLGQPDLAICELEEMNPKDLHGQQLAQVALLNYASGRWFRAIQQFSELPREVRVTLPKEYDRILFPRKYDEQIFDYASRLQLDPYLVLSLMRQESIFNRFAESPVGAKGLMQLMEPTAKLEVKKLKAGYLNKEEFQYIRERAGKGPWLFDPYVNIPIGIHHLHRLFGDSASVVFTLAGYNAGMNAVRRWQQTLPTKNLALFVERIPYKETRNYVKLIMRNYFYYKKMYEPENQDFPYLHAYFSKIIEKVQIN